MKKLLFLLLMATSVAHGETYRWTDDAGTIHFSDSRSSIPEQYRQGAKATDIDQQPKSSTGDGKSTTAPLVEGMKERMLADEGIMALARDLQDDPDMRAILNDPVLLKAVQAGDVATLMNNPAFLKLLTNPRVREIGEKLGTAGPAVK